EEKQRAREALALDAGQAHPVGGMGYVRFLIAFILSLSSASALAQPVKCIGANGKVQYIDKGVAEAQGLKCGAVRAETNTVKMQPGAINLNRPPKPADNAADSGALAAAEQKLAEARAKLAEQESIRSGDERNYARVQERLAPFQAAVQQAE